MQHVRLIDEHRCTVLMVQVENEVGIFGDSRDRSPIAEKAFQSAIPLQVLQLLRGARGHPTKDFQDRFGHLDAKRLAEATTWADLNGTLSEPHLDELFMAYHYAMYVERVAASGKTAYNIPLFSNVWQNYGDVDRDTNAPLVAAGGSLPGHYPSGGAVASMLGIWKMVTPSLDMICPDIYLNDYVSSCSKYRHQNQPLFIPEQRRDAYGARRIWPAFGSFQCIGTAPFGVDTVDPKDSPFTKHYKLLGKVSRIVLAAQARENSSFGFFFDEPSKDGTDPCSALTTCFGPWELTIERSFVFGEPAAGSGMVIQMSLNRFLLVGWGFQVKFRYVDEKAHFSGLLEFEEKDIDEQGIIRTVRRLNGDESRSGQYAVMPSEDPDYDGFPISITIPARTGIAMCEPYALLRG